MQNDQFRRGNSQVDASTGKRYIENMGSPVVRRWAVKGIVALISLLANLLAVVAGIGTLLGLMDWSRQMKELLVGVGLNPNLAPTVWVLVIFFAAIVYMGWPELLRLLQLDRLNFNLAAPDAATVVMRRLRMIHREAAEFLAQMALEGVVRVRAIKDGASVDSPVPADAFQDSVLYLMGDDERLKASVTWGMSYCKQGWIEPKDKRGIDNLAKISYRNPRFVKREIKDAVNWYKSNRPKGSS